MRYEAGPPLIFIPPALRFLTQKKTDLKPLINIYKDKLAARSGVAGIRSIHVSEDLKKDPALQLTGISSPQEREPSPYEFSTRPVKYSHGVLVETHPEGQTFYQPHPDAER